MTPSPYARDARSTAIWGAVPVAAFSVALALRSPWVALAVLVGALAAMAAINTGYLARSRSRRRHWTAEGRDAWDARLDGRSLAFLPGWEWRGWSDFSSVVVEVHDDTVHVHPRRGRRHPGQLDRSRIRDVEQLAIGHVSPEGWVMPTPFTHVRIADEERHHLDLVVLVDADAFVRALRTA